MTTEYLESSCFNSLLLPRRGDVIKRPGDVRVRCINYWSDERHSHCQLDRCDPTWLTQTRKVCLSPHSAIHMNITKTWSSLKWRILTSMTYYFKKLLELATTFLFSMLLGRGPVLVIEPGSWSITYPGLLRSKANKPQTGHFISPLFFISNVQNIPANTTGGRSYQLEIIKVNAAGNFPKGQNETWMLTSECGRWKSLSSGTQLKITWECFCTLRRQRKGEYSQVQWSMAVYNS